jgi:hypothetical protein
VNIQPDKEGAEPSRYIRFQFWLSDHGQPVLFNHWSDWQFEEAEFMLPDRIVDLQHWDTHSGTILNHLVDTGWQTGTMPCGFDSDEPIPEIQPDHETLCEPALKPPVTKKALSTRLALRNRLESHLKRLKRLRRALARSDKRHPKYSRYGYQSAFFQTRTSPKDLLTSARQNARPAFSH